MWPLVSLEQVSPDQKGHLGLSLVPSSMPFVTAATSLSFLTLSLSPPPLPAGPMGAMVTQNPRYQVTRRGTPVNLSCFQNMNHDTMYWYQQKPSQAPKLLFYYYDEGLNSEKDTSDNFKGSRPNPSFCSLGIRSPDLGDSAVYLCASSRDTELKPCLSSAHKPVSQIR